MVFGNGRPRIARIGRPRNVADAERVSSVALGAALITYGLRRRDPAGAVGVLVGSAFVLRGATGSCPVYRAIGVSTGSADAVLGLPRPDVTGLAATVNARKAVKVEHLVIIRAPRHQLYAFWHNFENLPRFMAHLVSVRVKSPTRSHWVAKGPAGTTVEWDAELVNDIPDTLIAWKSVPPMDVPNAGSVHFTDAPAARGTMVRVVLDYEPPIGKFAAVLARMFGADPAREVREDLLRFKKLMEGGTLVGSARRGPQSRYAGVVPGE
jgi:uncharacterized membrane protein